MGIQDNNYLAKFNSPIIALSPMDGVTDAPFRYITAKYGKPDLMFTEFTHVIGLCRGGERLWQDFIFSDLERPAFAQIFGTEPEYFYHAAKVVCELGFEGVDINMGCPARSVSERGAGAGLIQTPKLAQEIIRSVQKGVKDWYETGEVTGIDDEVKKRMKSMIEQRQRRAEADNIPFRRYAAGTERAMVPVSVKTRIGYAENTVVDWVNNLAETNPEWISIHGRMLKQLYSGTADWSAIAQAVQAVPHIPILANGDIKTREDIKRCLDTTGAAGVLVGRATYGNPWFFDPNKPEITKSERFRVMLEHAKLHQELKGEGALIQMRKHLGWYASGFDGAVELRKKLVTISSIQELENILSAN